MATVGVLCARGRVEEKALMTALAEAGIVSALDRSLPGEAGGPAIDHLPPLDVEVDPVLAIAHTHRPHGRRDRPEAQSHRAAWHAESFEQRLVIPCTLV